MEIYDKKPQAGSSCKEVIHWAGRIIQKKTSSQIPFREGEILAEYLLNVKREKLYINFQDPFPGDLLDLYCRKVEERGEGKPLAYITGIKEFMSLEFTVTPSVLIPRPETETLVEEIIEWINKKNRKNPLIFDIGTGSGNIALSLARYLPDSFIYASDISLPALEVAKKNAADLNLEGQIDFLRGDLLEPMKDKEILFDVIVSNPPYISPEDMANLPSGVKFEPQEALLSQEEGLFFFRKIIKAGFSFLKPGGLMAFEAGMGQAEKVSLLLHKQQAENIKIVKDLAGIERVILGETGCSGIR